MRDTCQCDQASAAYTPTAAHMLCCSFWRQGPVCLLTRCTAGCGVWPTLPFDQRQLHPHQTTAQHVSGLGEGCQLERP